MNEIDHGAARILITGAKGCLARKNAPGSVPALRSSKKSASIGVAPRNPVGVRVPDCFSILASNSPAFAFRADPGHLVSGVLGIDLDPWNRLGGS